MKWVKALTCFGVAALLFICASPLQAQNVVFNGDLEMEAIQPAWTLTGGNSNTTVVKFQTVSGENSWCVKRRPGTPNDNGNIEQQVHLIAGLDYNVKVDVAIVESG